MKKETDYRLSPTRIYLFECLLSGNRRRLIANCKEMLHFASCSNWRVCVCVHIRRKLDLVHFDDRGSGDRQSHNVVRMADGEHRNAGKL